MVVFFWLCVVEEMEIDLDTHIFGGRMDLGGWGADSQAFGMGGLVSVIYITHHFYSTGTANTIYTSNDAQQFGTRWIRGWGGLGMENTQSN